MSPSTDDQGRIYLPNDVRDRFGDTYRIVTLPGHVALFPVDDDPIEGILEAVDGAFDDVPADGMRERAREAEIDEIERRNASTEEN